MLPAEWRAVFVPLDALGVSVDSKGMLAAPPFKDFEFPTVLEALLTVAWADEELRNDEEAAIRDALSVLLGAQSSLTASSQRKPDPLAVAAKVRQLKSPQQLWILRQCYSLARADGDVAMEEIEAIKNLGAGLELSDDQWPNLLMNFAKYDELEMDVATLLEPTRAAEVCGVLGAHLHKKATRKRKWSPIRSHEGYATSSGYPTPAHFTCHNRQTPFGFASSSF